MKKLTVVSVFCVTAVLSGVFMTGCVDPWCDGYHCDSWGCYCADDSWTDDWTYECYSNAGCGGSEVCVNHYCVDPYYRVYRLDSISATADRSFSWDSFGGGPDMYACVYVDADSLGCTETAADSFSAYWDDWFEFNVYPGSYVEVVLYDYDASGDETMLTCSTGLTVGVLRSEDNIYCHHANGSDLSFAISL